MAPKKKYAPYPKSDIMYGVALAMMKEPSQVSAVVKETHSMRMSRGKISLAYVQVIPCQVAQMMNAFRYTATIAT
jgi:hypothetical protein